jgi:hypothetical protein
MDLTELHPGQTVVYDDGRPGHRGVSATICSVSESGMVVQFEDRADTTSIRFSDRPWMDHLKIKRETK